jgi:predicted nucleotidyltransferase
MGTSKTVSLSSSLFGKVRQAVLALFYTHPDETFYVRQVIRKVGVGQGVVQRELVQLSRVGILKKTTRGRETYYQANPDCSVFGELKSLMTKTAGVAEVVAEALAVLHDRIVIAFIYGSQASGAVTAQSDIDLMIIGDVAFKEVVDQISGIQEKLGREVNPTVYAMDEFKKKIAGRHHFIRAVLDKPKIFLIGDERELKGLAQ